jgi:hypothetical protein
MLLERRSLFADGVQNFMYSARLNVVSSTFSSYPPCGNFSRASSNSSPLIGKKRIWSKNRSDHGTPGANAAVDFHAFQT